MRKMTVIAAIALLYGLSSAAQACGIRGQRWQFGQTVSYSLTAKPGERCGHATRVFGTSVLESMRIGSKPRHGRAYVYGSDWGYRSAKGFTGQDSFSVLVRGHSPTAKDTTTINVSVSVR